MLALHYAESTRDVDVATWEELTLNAERYARKAYDATRIATAQMYELGGRVCAQMDMENSF